MSRDNSCYFEDRWNVFDLLGLVLLSSGSIARRVDSSSPWGEAFYALSAPLMISRILFFAQIFRFQGPMINVIFSMTAELFKFGIVIMVVIVGFAVSFHALVRDGPDDSVPGYLDEIFWVTLLTLFKAMLGEVGFFDEFSGSEDDGVATVLLVVYLVIITIMLLNLLVVILSTSHARVQENADREFRVSKARVIQHYRLVVDKHLLPAPFNLMQLVVSLPFWVVDRILGGNTRTRSSNKIVGQAVFCFMLCPIVVALGSLLWITSALYSTFVWRKHYSEEMQMMKVRARENNEFARQYQLRDQDAGLSRATFMALMHLFIWMWCLVGAPLYLLALSLRLPLVFRLIVRAVDCVTGQFVTRSPFEETPPLTIDNVFRAPAGGLIAHDLRRYLVDTERKKHIFKIEHMLKTPAGGVGADDLRRYLEDPMIDDEVREDERKKGATVEHMKLLRNRLETTLAGVSNKTDGQLKQLAKECADNEKEIADMKRMLQEMLSIMQETQRPPANVERNSSPPAGIQRSAKTGGKPGFAW